MRLIIVTLLVGAVLSFPGPVVAADLASRLDKCRDKSVHPIGRIEACTRIFDDESATSADIGKAIYARAIANKKLKNYEHALRDYTHVVTIWPKHWPSFHNRANIFRTIGNHEMALKDYNEAIRLKPDHMKAIANRGVLFEKLNRSADAARDFQRAYDLGMRNDLLRRKMVAHGLQYK